jgi:Flp pilus assembly protein TadG
MPGARRRGRDRGVSALEFALTAPIIAFVMLIVADIGNGLQQIVRLEAAARAGAQVAFTEPDEPEAIRTAVRESLQYWPLTTDSPPGDVTVTSSFTCMCVNTATTFNCTTGDPESSCGSPDFRQYVSVTVSRPARALLWVPITTLRGNVELRLR